MPRIQVTCDACNHTQPLISIEDFDEYYGTCSWCNEDVCDACGEGNPPKMIHTDCFNEEQAELDRPEYSGN